MTARAVVAAGSNIGDRVALLSRGLRLLGVHPQVVVAAVSAVYETDPVGGPEQADYLNVVALIDTDLAPRALLGLLHVVEAACDRERTIRWGPRTLDLDLVDYAGMTSSETGLELPHPRAQDRAFVLLPWHDVDPAAVLAGHGPISLLLRGVDVSGVRLRPDLRVAA